MIIIITTTTTTIIIAIIIIIKVNTNNDNKDFISRGHSFDFKLKTPNTLNPLIKHHDMANNLSLIFKMALDSHLDFDMTLTYN